MSVAASEMTTKAVTEPLGVLKAYIADIQHQMKRAGDELHKQNKEFQMSAATQCETHKLDHALPFCPTLISAAASEGSIKALTESFDVQKETTDMQLQVQIEDRGRRS